MIIQEFYVPRRQIESRDVIDEAIDKSGIEKTVIPRSRFGIRLRDWSSFWLSPIDIFYAQGPYTKNISEL